MFRLILLALALSPGLLPGQGFGKISGKITDAMTRQPIAKVHVGCMAGQQFVGVLSGVDGAYTLENVPPGPIRMTVNLEGYKLISGNGDPAAEFEIGAGETVTRNFAMHPLGRIYGRLTDRDSGKLIEAHIVFVERKEYVPGHVYYMQSRSEPNRGEFSIGSLEAGEYRVGIESWDEPVVSFSSDVQAAKSQSKKTYGQRWYPDVPRPEMAAFIHLGEGESMRLDLSFESHEAHSFSGVVVAPREFEHAPVSFGFLLDRKAIQMPAPGPFRIENLAPGRYLLSLVTGKPPRELAGDYELEIADRDIENFKAALVPEAGISGEIRMLEQDVKPPDQVVVDLVPTAGWMTRLGTRGALVAGPLPVRGISIRNGRFHEESIRAGEYWPQVMAAPEGYAVTAIQFEGASSHNNVLALSAPDTPITIVLTSRPGAVAGTVRTEDQTPLRGVTVALLPDPLPDRVAPATVRFVESGEGGTYAFKDVAPGKYRAVALAGDVDVRGDNGFRDLIAKSDVFEVSAAQTATVNLKR